MSSILKNVSNIVMQNLGAIPSGINSVVNGGNFLSGAMQGGLNTLGAMYGGPAAQVLGIINGAQTLLSGQTDKKGRPVEEVAAAQAPTFTPVKPQAATLPGSLSDLGNYSMDQQRSALATKGLNQGLSDEENSYYKNLVQRSLIGDNNQVSGSMDSLLPVEQQYFQKQGINMGDINSFLQGISPLRS